MPVSSRVAPLDETCGYELGCLPKKRKRIPLRFLQCFATAPWALAILSVGAFFQGFTVGGLINASITTLEMRFQLLSSEAGLISSCYDIASCLSLLFVTYVGGRGHKPLWLGWGIVFMGLGSIVFSLPRFIAPPQQIGKVQTTCALNGSQNSNSCTDKDLRSYRFAFYVAQLMMGVGATPLYTLGITYLDENVHQIKSSLYHGIYYAFSIMGPGIGFLLSGYFLTFHTTLETDPGLPESSPQFIGAWWLPFIIFGIVTCLIGLPTLLFPWQLPGTEQLRKNREAEMYEDEVANEIKNDEEFGKSFNDFPKCLLVLTRNISFIFISLGGAVDGLLVTGLSTFAPKIIESLFKVTSSQSAISLGAIAILGGAGGQVIGGWLVFKAKLSVKGIFRFCVGSSILSLLCSIIFLITCPNVLFAGANVPYPGSDFVIGNINAPCNVDCGCDSDVFDPVCGGDGITYYSSCFAGCLQTTDDLLTNCRCVGLNGNISLLFQNATKGLCNAEGCGDGLHVLFLFFLFFALLLTFVIAIPALQATIRIVPFTQRSFAIGVQWLLLRLLGTIPGPLLTGFVLDKACVIQGTTCEEQGSCSVYSNSDISRNITILVMVLKVFGFIFYTSAYVTYKAPAATTTSLLIEEINVMDINASTNKITVTMEDVDQRTL